MIYSCCNTIDQYHAVAAAGYQRIILQGTEISALSEPDFLHMRQTVMEGPIPCRALNSFCPPELKLCGPGWDLDAVSAYCALLLPRAAELGIEYVGVGGPKSRFMPDGYDRQTATGEFAKSVEVLLKQAKALGMAVLIEPLCLYECNFINTIQEAVDFVKSMGEDGLYVLFDSYHAVMVNDDPAMLARHYSYIKLVHVAHSQQNQRRCPAGDFLARNIPYFNVLRRCGYTGEMSLEAGFTGKENELADALAAMKELPCC